MLRALVLLTAWSTLVSAHVQQEDALAITDIEIGSPAPGSNTFTAKITNRSDTTVLAALDLRAMPGMWLLGNWQRQFGLELGPGEERRVQLEYEFTRMSPEARLRVRLGPGARRDDGLVQQQSIVFEQTYDVGEGNPAALDIDRYFVRVERGRLTIYAWRGSLAAAHVDEIAAQRLRAVEAIGKILGVAPSAPIRLVFYPDSASKTSQTGHIGAGLATGHNIVEIYNDEVQLDPFHELAHVLMYESGEPPPVLDEGFAVYISQRLGADALEELGSPGSSLDEAACRALHDGRAHTPEELIALEEIGSRQSRADVAYPEAGSLVGFLIERHGEGRFRELLLAAIAAEGPAAQRVERAIADVLEVGVSEVTAAWRTHLRAACD